MSENHLVVLYDDLKQGIADFGEVDKAIENAQTYMNTLSDSVSAINDIHGCMGESTAAIEKCQIILENWKTQNKFLIDACNSIITTFTDAEGNIIKDTTKIDDTSLIDPILKLFDETPSLEDANIYDNKQAYIDDGGLLQPETGAETSRKTWNKIFHDPDEGEGEVDNAKLELTETGAEISSGVESKIPEDEQTETTPEETKPKTIPDETNPEEVQPRVDDSNNSGNPGNNSSNGGNPGSNLSNGGNPGNNTSISGKQQKRSTEDKIEETKKENSTETTKKQEDRKTTEDTKKNNDQTQESGEKPAQDTNKDNGQSQESAQKPAQDTNKDNGQAQNNEQQPTQTAQQPAQEAVQQVAQDNTNNVQNPQPAPSYTTGNQYGGAYSGTGAAPAPTHQGNLNGPEQTAADPNGTDGTSGTNEAGNTNDNNSSTGTNTTIGTQPGNDSGIATTKHTTITPTSSKIETTSTDKSSSGGNVAIPIVAGLAAAAAAGVGAKIYLDKKNEDEDEEDGTAEEWEGDFETEDQPVEQVLDNTDDFGYQAQTATENVDLEASTDTGNGYQAISFDDISETH